MNKVGVMEKIIDLTLRGVKFEDDRLYCFLCVLLNGSVGTFWWGVAEGAARAADAPEKPVNYDGPFYSVKA